MALAIGLSDNLQAAPLLDKEMLLEAAQVGALEFMRQILDSKRSAPVAAGGYPQGTTANTGTHLVWLAGMVLSADEMGKAETDNQRFYSGLRMAGTAISAALPPVGAAITIGATLAQLGEAVLAMEHNKQMLRVYAEIMNNYKVLMEINLDLATREGAELGYLLDSMNSNSSRVEGIRKYLAQNCRESNKIKTFDQVITCAEHIASLVQHLEVYVRLGDRFVNYKPAFVHPEKHKDFSDRLIIHLRPAQEELSQIRKSVDTALLELSQLFFRLVKESAAKSGMPFADSFYHACRKKCSDLTWVENVFYIRRGRIEAWHYETSLTRLHSHMRTFWASCYEPLSVSKNPVDKRLLAQFEAATKRTTEQMRTVK